MGANNGINLWLGGQTARHLEEGGGGRTMQGLDRAL